MFGITNNFENFKYDVFFFELDEEGNSADLECYKDEVKRVKRFDTIDKERWVEICEWDTTKTTIQTGLTSTVKKIKTIN